MQDEQVGQPEETEEPDAEATTDEPEAAAGDSAAEGASADAGEAAAPPDPPTGGAGEEVLKAPEVPDDANEKISAAQQHINSLNMDDQRSAAERAQKQT